MAYKKGETYLPVFIYSPRHSILCHELSRTSGQSKWFRIAGILNKYIRLENSRMILATTVLTVYGVVQVQLIFNKIIYTFELLKYNEGTTCQNHWTGLRAARAGV
jgi:hypothetical protein